MENFDQIQSDTLFIGHVCLLCMYHQDHNHPTFSTIFILFVQTSNSCVYTYMNFIMRYSKHHSWEIQHERTTIIIWSNGLITSGISMRVECSWNSKVSYRSNCECKSENRQLENLKIVMCEDTVLVCGNGEKVPHYGTLIAYSKNLTASTISRPLNIFINMTCNLKSFSRHVDVLLYRTPEFRLYMYLPLISGTGVTVLLRQQQSISIRINQNYVTVSV